MTDDLTGAVACLRVDCVEIGVDVAEEFADVVGCLAAVCLCLLRLRHRRHPNLLWSITLQAPLDFCGGRRNYPGCVDVDVHGMC